MKKVYKKSFIFDLLLSRFFKPARFIVINKLERRFLSKKISILDIGCGPDSYKFTKKWIPKCKYVGLDHINLNDFISNKNTDDIFIEGDLSKKDYLYKLDSLKLNFDLIIISHVIEHLNNGIELIKDLEKFLKPNGFMYVETPSPRTLKFPKAEGFLNFYDDPTHKRLFYPHEIDDAFHSSGLRVVKSSVRRIFFRAIFFGIISISLNLFWYLPFKRKIKSAGLWDLLGVAWVVVGKK